tara:strand:+ start:307 stop:513 length:207 start_codon:yes stop_codon:yes gene_type:complete
VVVMSLPYLDLVDTVERLSKICKELNITDILEGDAKQIEIISEIKTRIESLELERVEPIDMGYPPYKA